ncbi:MAG: phytanoyl-CoA dioxygenase family protein, partial [Woeseiaceae bacterium]
MQKMVPSDVSQTPRVDTMPAADAVDDQLDSAVEDIRTLGLESQLAELESLGLTVIPPDKAAAPGFAGRLRDAVLRAAADRFGTEADLVDGSTHADIEATAGQRGETWLWRLLFEDPVFEEALENPVALALVTSLLGYSAKLSNSSAVIKGPVHIDAAPHALNLHSDNRGIPAPFPTYAQVANVTWALTDYSLENGCVGYVPASHLLCRQPTPNEALDAVVPVEAEAGSLI